MFTVSGRVINELVELTCAINFSLLFRFEARAQNRKKREQNKPELSWWMEGRKGEEGRGNTQTTALPPICLQMIIRSQPHSD